MIERTQCPITGAESEVVFRRPYDGQLMEPMVRKYQASDLLRGLSYEIRYCRTSDLHFQTWVMEDHELGRVYASKEGSRGIWETIAGERLYAYAHAAEDVLAVRQTLGIPKPRVLDFGCSWGKFAGMAQAFGCEVFGVEVDREAATFAASRGIRIIPHAEVASHSFDCINVDQVAEHLTDPLGVIRSLAPSLRPGGLFKISTPSPHQLPEILRRAQGDGSDSLLNEKNIDPLMPLQHVNLFTPAALQLLGRSAGLTPFRFSFLTWLGAGLLWTHPRQFNHNLVSAWKRATGKSTCQWFTKSGAQG